MQIEKILIEWYEENKRDFPWRHTKNPYYIWVCEVMSQQTQLNRVVDYYHRFLQFFPTIESLACANQDDLLKAWEGLGYYSRVRNMQIAAQTILREYRGAFPDTYDELLKLKGVGTYTAASVAAIAFAEPVVAVDGNVLRVYARLIEMEDDILKQRTKNKVKAELEKIITSYNPSSFNQGLIELGATICLPKNPKCERCPLQSHCLAYLKTTYHQYPKKQKKKPQEIFCYQTFVVVDQNGLVYMLQDKEQNFLHGLYQLPQIIDNDDEVEIWWRENFLDVMIQNMSYQGVFKHIFSHKIWQMRVYVISIELGDYRFVDTKKVAMTNAHRKILDALNI